MVCTPRVYLLALLASFLLGGASTAQTVTIDSLLKEMTARDVLARLPKPAYKCSQASSYDRKSVSPDDHKSWMANGDRSQWVRIDKKENGEREFVMMDVQGPGAIVRVWATWHGPRGKPFSNGTLRVYLDGSDTPAIEGPIQSVLDQGLLAGAPLSQSVSPETGYQHRGHNLYLPIPYAKGCKVTYTTDVLMDIGARRGEALYYQINYRSYEEGTAVESFTMDRLAKAKSVLDETQERLSGKRRIVQKGKTANLDATVPPGTESKPLVIEGPAALRKLKLRLEANDLPQALRSTILKIEFDGEPTVWVPVGDFFGMGYMPSDHQTWYTSSTNEADLECQWVMPFEKQAKITLHNLGDQPVEVVSSEVLSNAWKWDDRSMHFHATWHEMNRAPTRIGSKRPGEGSYDVNYVTIKGQGVYVGDTLTLFNGARRWWGEGDEKIYVDGEDFPSHFGTGTEDYYGYAWCRPENFSAPFHAQPDGRGNLIGGFSVNSRFRSLDAIPFDESLKFDMENWHWADTKINYAPTTYFYTRPGASTNRKPVPESAAEEVVTERSEFMELFKVHGAIEGEDLRVIKRTGGKSPVQFQGSFGWSGDAQIWWQDAKVGDTLALELKAPKQGRYKVQACLTKAIDYGMVEVAINGKESKAGTLDRYHATVGTDLLDLGEHDLKKGANVVEVRLTGQNKKAQPRRMFGLDYMKLSPVEKN